MSGRADTWNTRGIVLQYRPWREYDRLYTVYTEAFGKQTLRVHGIRRPKAKLAGALEPFAEIELYGIPAKHYPKIGGAMVVQRFGQLKNTLERFNSAVYCCELLARLTKDNVPDQAIYQLLYSTLVWLDQQPPSRLITAGYSVKLIHDLGFAGVTPSLDESTTKLIRWMTAQPYSAIQKLRLTDAAWQNLQTTIHTWLYEYLGDDVQSERFLVY